MFLPACGEKWHSIRPVWLPVGSPPRVRGKGHSSLRCRLCVRITPACAGKSGRSSRTRSRWTDHPRVCGEKGHRGLPLPPFVGSPPRVRGKAGRDGDGREVPGITPACAGKRYTGYHHEHHARDHPRVCGEKSVTGICSGSVKGSPPRVRGKDCALCEKDDSLRITPACAGKRTWWGSPSCSGGDHPRVCGEKCQSRFFAASAAGSPPRVRGKGNIEKIGIQIDRITPACAGKRVLGILRCFVRTDHPRVCGEKSADHSLLL